MNRLARLGALCALMLAVAAVAVPARAEISDLPEVGVRDHQLECMALNLYWEAGRGSDLDLRAVAHVTINRAADPAFPSDVCGVVTQGGEKPLNTCQFSWWCDGRSDQPTDLAAWRKALGVAEEVMTGQDDVDPTDGALYFHNTSVKPSWVRSLQPTVKIGNHLFYR